MDYLSQVEIIIVNQKNKAIGRNVETFGEEEAYLRKRTSSTDEHICFLPNTQIYDSGEFSA